MHDPFSLEMELDWKGTGMMCGRRLSWTLLVLVLGAAAPAADAPARGTVRSTPDGWFSIDLPADWSDPAAADRAIQKMPGPEQPVLVVPPGSKGQWYRIHGKDDIDEINLMYGAGGVRVSTAEAGDFRDELEEGTARQAPGRVTIESVDVVRLSDRPSYRAVRRIDPAGGRPIASVVDFIPGRRHCYVVTFTARGDRFAERVAGFDALARTIRVRDPLPPPLTRAWRFIQLGVSLAAVIGFFVLLRYARTTPPSRPKRKPVEE